MSDDRLKRLRRWLNYFKSNPKQKPMWGTNAEMLAWLTSEINTETKKKKSKQL